MHRMSVANIKREFSSVLKDAERGEHTVVLRHGKPVAVIGPVAGPNGAPALTTARHQGGLLALVGLLNDWDTIDEDIGAIVTERGQALDRAVPVFD